MQRVLVKTVILFLFWMLLSGIFDAFHLSLGLITSLAVAWLTREETRLNIGEVPGLILRSLFYVSWLLSRIILAAWHVTKIILDPSLPIAPQFRKHKTSLKGDDAKMVFSNSITLTPGTITADIKGSDMVIHEIDKDSYGDIQSGDMEKQIEKIFKS